MNFQVFLVEYVLTTYVLIAITFDGNMCVTTHYVDTNLIFPKRIVVFRHVSRPHSSYVPGQKFIIILTEWGIEKKLH